MLCHTMLCHTIMDLLPYYQIVEGSFLPRVVFGITVLYGRSRWLLLKTEQKPTIKYLVIAHQFLAKGVSKRYGNPGIAKMMLITAS